MPVRVLSTQRTGFRAPLCRDSPTRGTGDGGDRDAGADHCRGRPPGRRPRAHRVHAAVRPGHAATGAAAGQRRRHSGRPRPAPPDALRALRLAARRITAFHRRQLTPSWSYRDPVGLQLGQRIVALDRVGLYVPGGHAAYPSSVLMNAIPARVAGVREVIMVSPPGSDGTNAAVLAAAAIAGVNAVFRIGGAQAVAALAYGTASVPRVDKIVGPGNAWVQAAKKIVYGAVDIDMIAGPSEVVVIADQTAPPAYVAADLLAQAEHGSGDECAVLLTPSRRLALAVQAEIESQLRTLAAAAGYRSRPSPPWSLGGRAPPRGSGSARQRDRAGTPGADRQPSATLGGAGPQRRGVIPRAVFAGGARGLRRRAESRSADWGERTFLLTARRV